MTMKDMCAYCAKWFPIEEMKQHPDEYKNWYCPKCYPDVLEAHWKLPWNRKEYGGS
jgi:hypothetical protein